MNLIARIAESRIEEAIERGELDDLPGAGRPLDLAVDAMVPPELRAGYRLLKNGGFLPPELELRGEIAAAERLVAAAVGVDERRAAWRRLDLLKLRLEGARGRPLEPAVEEAYHRRLLARLGDAPDGGA